MPSAKPKKDFAVDTGGGGRFSFSPVVGQAFASLPVTGLQTVVGFGTSFFFRASDFYIKRIHRSIARA
jgi:hypothetical protein